VLKLSGEALAGERGFGIDSGIITNVAAEVAQVARGGVQTAVVIGGGNFLRGATTEGVSPLAGDAMGMLATVINSVAFAERVKVCGVDARVLTATRLDRVGEYYTPVRAIELMASGTVVIIGGGTGSPFFTTDTAAVLRAAEIHADIVLLAKNNVDGVYSADPKKFPDAEKLADVKYQNILVDENLGVMDTTAASFSMDNDIPILVIGVDDPENIIKALKGEKIGTMIQK
jgi:uridylate kinase